MTGGTEREDTLFGAARFFSAACATECTVETVFIKCLLQPKSNKQFAR